MSLYHLFLRQPGWTLSIRLSYFPPLSRIKAFARNDRFLFPSLVLLENPTPPHLHSTPILHGRGKEFVRRHHVCLFVGWILVFFLTAGMLSVVYVWGRGDGGIWAGIWGWTVDGSMYMYTTAIECLRADVLSSLVVSYEAGRVGLGEVVSGSRTSWGGRGSKGQASVVGRNLSGFPGSSWKSSGTRRGLTIPT